MVIEAGTDDALDGNVHWRARGFDPAVKAVESLSCVVWAEAPAYVDYYATLKTHGPDLKIGVGWNAALRAAVSEHRNFRMVDISPIGHHPYVGADGVHPNAAGQRWLANQYATAAASCTTR